MELLLHRDYPALLIFSGLLAVCIVAFFATFGREDLKDNNIDNVVACCGFSSLIGFAIGYQTSEVLIPIVGVLGPPLLFALMVTIHRKVGRKK